MNIIRVLIGLAGILAVVPGAYAAQPSDDLQGTAWWLVSIDGERDTAGITLEFDTEEMRAGGFAGCNTYDGDYTVDDESISFSESFSTMMACLDVEQEQAYLTALDAATTYERTENELIIVYGEGQQLVFEQAGLAGTQWQLASYGENAVLQDTPITLTFGEDGEASGNGGCNRYSTSYTVDEDTISFDPILSTKRACIEEEGTAQEQAYFAALQAAQSFEVQSDEFTIVYGDEEKEELIFLRERPQVEATEEAPCEDC